MKKQLSTEELKEMFVELGGYDGIRKADNIMGLDEGWVSTSISTSENETSIIVGSSEDGLKKMLFNAFLDYMKKTNLTVFVSSDKHGKVGFTNRKEYDTTTAEMSRYYTTSLSVYGDNVDEEYNVKQHKNPSFMDNPECPQCYKKKATLYSTTNVQGKKVNVCNKCRSHLEMAKEFMNEK